MKILSIVVPIYNTEKYIRRCLDSLFLEEVVDDIEVIMVNDGSSDDSEKIMDEYKKRFPRDIVLINKENGGHGSTINSGLKIATGKYFKVIDSDDWVNSIDFIKFVKKLKNLNCDLVVTNYRKEHVYNGVSEYFEYSNLEENKIYDFDQFNLKILKGEYFVMATSTYKRDVLLKSKLELLEKSFYVDMQYNTIPIKEIKTFAYLNLDIYRYYLGRKDQSMNLQNFVKNKEHHNNVMRFLVEHYTKHSKKMSLNKKKYYKMIINYMLNTHYTIYCLQDKDYRNAYKEIKGFDKFLKKTSLEIYEMSNEIGLIRSQRKAKFLFVRIGHNFFKYFTFLYGKIRHG